MQVKVLSNINSGQYVAGDIAEFDDAEAEALIQTGAAEALAETAPQAASDEPKADGFPIHPSKAEDAAPATEAPTEPQAPAAPEAPATGAPLASSSEAQSAPSPAASNEDKAPTPEQIAQDVAGL